MLGITQKELTELGNALLAQAPPVCPACRREVRLMEKFGVALRFHLGDEAHDVVLCTDCMAKARRDKRREPYVRLMRRMFIKPEKYDTALIRQLKTPGSEAYELRRALLERFRSHPQIH